jgi:hypothetical protein
MLIDFLQKKSKKPSKLYRTCFDTRWGNSPELFQIWKEKCTYG